MAMINACGQQDIGSCDMQLRELYRCYTELVSGRNVVRMQSADFRSVEYGQGDIPALIQLYNQLWDTCGLTSGLPRLGARRGGPVYLGC